MKILMIITLLASWAMAEDPVAPTPPAAPPEAPAPNPARNEALPALPVVAQPETAASSGVAAPAVKAKRVIVVDDATGRVIYEKNSMERCAVASTQKMLTALCVTDAGPLTDLVYVHKTDTQVEPSKLYIRQGDKYKRSDLLKALLVKSGNDVAKALARDVAGSQDKFVKLMNAKAKKLGMKDSLFLNAHGLTAEGQYSTARDIAILARSAIRNPTLASYMKTTGYYFKPTNRKKKWVDNSNVLLRKVKYCTGMKTGTTRASGNCLVSSGSLYGRKVIVVCLGSDYNNIWKDSESLLKWSLEKHVPKADAGTNNAQRRAIIVE